MTRPDPQTPPARGCPPDLVLVLPTTGPVPEPTPVTATRTLTHAYEAVRNEQQEVVDFRLRFDHINASDATRSFDGVQVVQCGPSVAPGEIFHTLKRVLETGESQEMVIRHVQGGQEFCFHQTAAKSGDTVITTTSIASTR